MLTSGWWFSEDDSGEWCSEECYLAYWEREPEAMMRFEDCLDYEVWEEEYKIRLAEMGSITCNQCGLTETT